MKKPPEIDGCPFCNCADVALHKNFDYVYCKNCGAKGSQFDGHPYDAIASWNRVSKQARFTLR